MPAVLAAMMQGKEM